MDHTKQQQQSGEGGRSGGGGGAAYLSRPSGTRWIPTAEQIRILRELYYNCGIRSPNSEQIQRIAAMLRQYGKIEGKNVFYWFQNHKARERQKKRLTNLDINASPTSSSAADNTTTTNHHGLPSLSPGSAAPSSSALYTSHGTVLLEVSSWDSTAVVTAERSFLEYLGVRSTGDDGNAATAPTPWTCFSSDQTPMTTTRELETLPLFPVGDDSRPRHDGRGEGCQETIYNSYLPNFQCWGATTASAAAATTAGQQEQHSFYSNSNQLPSHDAAAVAGTSLELTLSSYCCPYPAGSI